MPLLLNLTNHLRTLSTCKPTMGAISGTRYCSSDDSRMISARCFRGTVLPGHDLLWRPFHPKSAVVQTTVLAWKFTSFRDIVQSGNSERGFLSAWTNLKSRYYIVSRILCCRYFPSITAKSNADNRT